VLVVQLLYEDAATVVRVNGCDSKVFGVRVGIHLGSILVNSEPMVSS